MKITRELVQPIINQLMPLVEKNINIMDEKGVIIASGDDSRVNQFHAGAKVVLEKECEFIERGNSNISGTKKGVNLPIYLNEKNVGVVGITGDPDAVYNLARVVKVTVEVLLQQTYLNKQTRYREEAIQSWLSNLTDSFSFNQERLAQTAKLLSINIQHKRSILVIRLDAVNHIKPQENFTRFLNEFKNKKDNLISQIGNYLDNSMYLLLRNESELVVLGKSTKSDNLKLAQNIINICEKLKISVCIGIGDIGSDINKYRNSFLQAKKCLKLMKKTKVYSEKHQKIAHIDEYRIPYLIAQIPKSTRQSFITQYVSDQWISRDHEETLITYFNVGTNIRQAAKQLFIHPNTLLYRLDRIEKITQLNPRLANDAFILQLIMICQMLESS